MKKLSNWEQINISGKDFVDEWKDWGLKVAIGNYLIVFTKWFIGAKRVKIIYK